MDHPPRDAAPPPRATATAGMSEAELAEARQYARLGLAAALADRALDLAYLTVAAVWIAPPLDRWLSGLPLGGFRSLRLVALFVLVMALHAAVSLPLTYWSGFTLEHRYGLSTLTRRGWAWRYAKMLLLAVVLGAVLYLGLFWIIWLTHGWWWLIAAAAFFLVSILLARIYPVLIEPLFYTIERLDDPELQARMARLSEGTGLSIEGVYRMALSEETKKANAQLAGLGRTRRVLLGDTLLSQYTPEEIEVIFAHEIGHHVHGHIRKLIAAGLALSAAAFFLCDGVLRLWVGGDYGDLPTRALPVLMLVLGALQTVLGPLQNAISRRFERQSDRYALERTAAPEAFQSAFRRLARQNKEDPDPPRWEVFFFHSHPPVAERLAMAERWARERARP